MARRTRPPTRDALTSPTGPSCVTWCIVHGNGSLVSVKERGSLSDSTRRHRTCMNECGEIWLIVQSAATRFLLICCRCVCHECFKFYVHRTCIPSFVHLLCSICPSRPRSITSGPADWRGLQDWSPASRRRSPIHRSLRGRLCRKTVQSALWAT